MARGKKAKKRITLIDPRYGSKMVTKLINRVMRDGKKSVAQSQVYEAFAEIEKKTKKSPLEVFTQAIENIKPMMEVRPRRIGGAAYQVPIPVRGGRRDSLAIRWLVLSSRELPNKEYHRYSLKLASEIMNAANNEGVAIKKKENMQRMADANKAFAHFRW
ncbi:30S ribosomal protein S7 [Patescibacteria group bacterium]|nr:30S ribosomal protein S7 [Patescibacteria group bacterium]